MKRLVFCICLLMSVQIMSAQIITSSQVGTVEKVKNPQKPKKEFEKVPLEKGYRGFVEAALSLNILSGTVPGFDLLTTQGWQANNWLYLGAGTGLLGTGQLNHSYLEHNYVNNREYIDNYTLALTFSIPIFANVRFYVLDTRVKPFIDVKIGGLIPIGPATAEVREFINDGKWNTGCIISSGYSGYHYGTTEVMVPVGESLYRKYDSRQSGVFFQFGFGVEYKRFDFGFNYVLKGRHITEYRNTGNVPYASFYGMDPLSFTFNFGYNF